MINLHKKYKIRNNFKAQSLLELLLSIAIGTILIGGSVLLMGTSLRGFSAIKQKTTINSLLRQQNEIIISLAQDNWHNIYDLTRNSNYYATSTNNVLTISSGQQEGIINSISYKRYFKVFDTYRDSNGNLADSGTVDPNTLKVTSILEYGYNFNSSSSLNFYLTRSTNNQVIQQTDWSQGEGYEGPVPYPDNKFYSQSNINYTTVGQLTMATTTISSELISSIIDTGISGGAGFNSLLWQGNTNGGSVKFQIALSNSSTGPWTYYGCTTSGSACLISSNWTTSSSSVAVLSPNVSLPLASNFQNFRYIRYKVFLSTSGSSPQINDIIINWSP